GVLAAIAIPSFMDYMQKSKRTEATLQLKSIATRAKSYLIENGRFPVGSAPLTPDAPCCAGPHAKCNSTPNDWSTPAWRALDLRLDEPHLYQYSYSSDGNTFEALAVGDLDCDTVMVTYTLNIDSGGQSMISGPSNPD